MNAEGPDPRRNGAGGVRTDGHTPANAPADPERRLAGPVSRLDRVTLQLGVAVAVVIAVCSYAVSATSLYALGTHPCLAAVAAGGRRASQGEGVTAMAAAGQLAG